MYTFDSKEGGVYTPAAPNPQRLGDFLRGEKPKKIQIWNRWKRFATKVGWLDGWNSVWFTLHGQDLSNLDLSGINLSGFDLHKTNLDNSYLSNSDLRNAIMGGGDFVGSSYRGTNFSYSNLSGSTLSYSNFSGANLSYTSLCGCRMERSNFQDADFRYATLRNTNLQYAISLSNADFRHARVGKKERKTILKSMKVSLEASPAI
ncbi:MAG: pentapeptide repeat-containing protein [archaeon]